MTSPTTLQQRLREIAATLTSPGEVDTLLYAADELGRVTSALAEAPHSTLCAYMVDHFREPCSCWKADPSPLFAVTGATTITYGDVRRLTIAGPHGPVLALPRVGSARVELDGDRLTVHYDNPET